jgi:hypothetical protein
MFRVEIRIADENSLADGLEAMRAWLAAEKCTPLSFGYSLSPSVLFRVDFAEEAEARIFADAFGGAIVH